jgi:integrase
MAVLAECPKCHRRQGYKRSDCIKCGHDLEKLRRNQKLRLWIVYRVNGKQKWEFAGYKVGDAKDAQSKRAVQKREEPNIFKANDDQTLADLNTWYLDLEVVKGKRFAVTQAYLNQFKDVLGDKKVRELEPIDLENYQLRREREGLQPATIDGHIGAAKAMVVKAFDNDKITGHAVKVFRKVRKKHQHGDNARERTLTIEEYLSLAANSTDHLEALIVVGMHTGMRRGELLKLKWSHIDWEAGFIRLTEGMTKEGKKKKIPMNHHVESVLHGLYQVARFREKDIKPQGHVFTYKGKPIKGFNDSLKTACVNAKIEYGRTETGFIFHDLRRTFKTNMLAAGVQKTYRDVIVGHRLKGMDIHYIKPSEDDLCRAMDQYTMWFDSQVESVSKTVSKAVNSEEVIEHG